MTGPSIDSGEHPQMPWWFSLCWWIFVVSVLVLIGYAYCTG